MKNRIGGLLAVVIFALSAPAGICRANAAPDATLPVGVKAVWDLSRAWRDTTPTRDRVCLNGLWRWQPAEADANGKKGAVEPPTGDWGYFKAPGPWPGGGDYLQHDSQTVFPAPAWKGRNLRDLSAAWYEREFTTPADWAGRRLTLRLEDLNSFAAVFVDGKRIGDLRFPAGELDLTAACRPGQTQRLDLLVVAMPLKAVRLSYTDSEAARQVKGSVARRGLCGDVYLDATPPGARIDALRVDPSVRHSRATLDADLAGLAPHARYALRVRISRDGRPVAEFNSPPFTDADAPEGRFSFSADWKPDRLWDLDAPANQYDAQATLLPARGDGKALDVGWPERFGFRELWIEGRDFYLNGTRLNLCAVPVDNASIGAAWASYAGCRETLERLKAIGINFVYTHNYDCEPGAHLALSPLLRAADDVGMLVALTQPHFSSYDWKAPGADETNGYARDAAYYAGVARNHPSVVFYAMSHNATGYDQDMNPDLIDGKQEARDSWARENAKLALRAEAIVRRLDPTRIVYHHAGGNIGAMYTVNFYPNFAPIQELSDWFQHWTDAGVKPLFLCEYGAPFTWDWTSYRGWYKGRREFGSAEVPWEFCLAEYNAELLGDRAFAPNELMSVDLRWEAEQFKAGRLWHRWDYPTPVGSARFDERNEVLGQYLADNWRAYRTLGVSGISPWEYRVYWTPRPGADRSRVSMKVDWNDLQRPGFSADYIDQREEGMDVALQRGDWIPTAAGKALLRNNQPVLAYIAGRPAAITSQDHDFLPGQVVEKQLTIINNSRRAMSVQVDWSLSLAPPIAGSAKATVQTGQQARLPVKIDLPAALAPGAYALRATFHFGDGDGERQDDAFTIDVLPKPGAAALPAPIALFDPVGQTAALLDRLGVRYRKISAGDPLKAGDTLVIGKLALTIDGPAPDLSAVRRGMKAIVFEQSPDVLEKRLGMRAEAHGLRQVFERVPGHPLLSGITPADLHDWTGDATTLPPRLKYVSVPQHGPMVRWCDIPVSRVWRCGNRGDVASALIEKPARGDFLPVLDGGFSLQFSPLLEYREGAGMVLFCQLDVTGRSEDDPAATALAANCLRYVADWKPTPTRSVVYAGEEAGLAYLKSAGFEPAGFDALKLTPTEQVLVIGPGGGRQLAPHADAVAAFLKAGGRVLAVAIDQADADAALPGKIRLHRAEHITASFDAPGVASPLAGVGPADLYNRGPREFSLVQTGAGDASAPGDGVIACVRGEGGRPAVVFCQIAPWQFDYRAAYDLKRTFRRSACALDRLLANLGARGGTPLLDRFAAPAQPGDRRWLDGLYLDAPQEWDDPYRFFRW